MNQIFNRPVGLEKPAPAVPFDAGLRRHMLGIYRHMAVGLAVTGATAFAVVNVPTLYNAIFGSPLKWIAMLAPLGFVLYMTLRIDKMSRARLHVTFLAFAATMGVSMASIFMTFSGTSIARAFFIAAGMFLATSLWGYTTRRDLSRWGTFLVMGLIGVVLAMLVNLALGSSTLLLVLSLVGVIVFTGLTAYDTQRAKSDYVHFAGTPHEGKLAVMGALSLYLNLVNLVQLMLLFTGASED